jgi:hypothetical protein
VCVICCKLQAVDLTRLDIYIYQLHTADMAMEELDDDENIPAGNHWVLPSAQFEGLWESLVFDEDVKSNVNISFIFLFHLFVVEHG